MSDERQVKNPSTRKDANQITQIVYNEQDNSLTVAGYVSSKIGAKVTRVNTNPINLGLAAAGDDFSTYDGAVLLYTIRVLYNDVDKNDLMSVERIA